MTLFRSHPVGATKKRSARFDAILSILLLLGLAVLFYTMRYGPLPFTQQIRNLKAAELHAPALQSRLNQDARYAGLKAGIWPGEGGCLSVHGVLNSEADLPELKKLVMASKPPVGVIYHLELPTGEHLGGWQPLK